MVAPAPAAPPARVTLTEFQAMDLDHHAELILGRIFEPMAESFRHVDATDRLQELLANRFPDQWVIRDAPLPIPEDGEPRPDTIVFQHSKPTYRERGGYDASDAVLVAEICLSSYERDYKLKDPQYALAKIPEYWIIDLDESQIEVRTEPQLWGYARRAVFSPGEPVKGIPVNEFLGLDPA